MYISATMNKLTITLIFCTLLKCISTSNILFMGPFPAPSHWMWLEHFQRDLLRKGHHVTTVNNHPTKYPHPNLTEIIIDPKFDIPALIPKSVIFEMRFASDFQNLEMWWTLGVLTSEHVLNDPKVKAIIASKNLKFDLFIIEQFFHESFLMFAHKFKCPIVTIGTMGYADNMDHAMGLVTPWSIIPHLLLPHTDQMTFTQRFYNTYLSLYDTIWRRWYYIPQMQKQAEQHFGPYIEGPLPYVRDLERNISLMLINSHRSIDLPRPGMPGLVNVGGAHIQPAKPLPKNIKEFIEGATHGVVYFTLGSYVQGTDMPPEKISLILNAFSQLKQRVLWKFENESLGSLPPNVMIQKWMPQNDILAHPNIKLFMTHGGIFGTQEGIYWGVPMLCIPLYGDQHRNTLKSIREGYARSLVFSKMTSDDIVENIKTLIDDPKYKQKALEVSAKFRDNPIHPLEEATYWIEYVMRYKGAPHLKSYGSFIPLYQYLLLDVFFTMFLILFLAIWLPWRLTMYLIRLTRAKPKVDTKKKRK